MIIQCRKCETRFRFDDSLIAGDGVWVRCSRCQHVFFQQRATGDASVVEPDIPSVRISDARRSPDDRLPAVDDRLKPTETRAEPLQPASLRSERERAEIPPPPVRQKRATEPDFDKELSIAGLGEDFDREPSIVGRGADFDREPSIAELGTDFGKEPFAGPLVADGDGKESVEMVKEALARLVVADEKEDGAEMEEEEFAEDGPARRGWGWTLLKLFVLLVFVGVVAGTVYLYLFPEIRTQVLKWAAPQLRGVPVLENLLPSQTKSGESALAPVLIKDLRQRSVANILTGDLSVIEGVAVNQASYPLARIRVRLLITGAENVVLGEKIVYCGNLLTDAEMGALAEPEIQRELAIPQGSDFSNELILPNSGIPFMIVFNQEPGTVKATVTLAGAERLP